MGSRVSTNALTGRYLASLGLHSETVQTWRGRVRHDLFNFVDTVALTPQGILWIQNCSYGSLKAHRDEIDASPHLPWMTRHRQHIALYEWRRKREGQRKNFYLRKQLWQGVWDEVTDWEGPLDLYPR